MINDRHCPFPAPQSLRCKQQPWIAMNPQWYLEWGSNLDSERHLDRSTAGEIPSEQEERFWKLLGKLEEAYNRHRTRWQGKVSGRDNRVTSAWTWLQWSQSILLLNFLSRAKHQKNEIHRTCHQIWQITQSMQGSSRYLLFWFQESGNLGFSPAVPTVLPYSLQCSRHLHWGALGSTRPLHGAELSHLSKNTVFSGALWGGRKNPKQTTKTKTSSNHNPTIPLLKLKTPT